MMNRHDTVLDSQKGILQTTSTSKQGFRASYYRNAINLKCSSSQEVQCIALLPVGCPKPSAVIV
jgi:hypothetical protein